MLLCPPPPAQWYSYTANVTGLLHVKTCAVDPLGAYYPAFVLRTDAISAAGAGIAQVPGCGNCDAPIT